ncbi:G-type lectin S-receptor-like serine/threonine-protein kinase [Pyrus ussuriensis x Pyrus communis]|uniref:G-type lectin S-receptor-like serine/threonine-protein kinase n=1 Tax=Pyrus ussuriensis x Pyrus communis TaxID=2448454 RepID=A0A5N5H4Q6_9ROSA|nr:G-type lectin S-receptor-like serine/threonine-protein kinase [Pyrus ussuriensis x Pyrus communis]
MSLWRNQLHSHLTAELVEIGGNIGKGKVYITWKGWVGIRCPAAMPDWKLGSQRSCGHRESVLNSVFGADIQIGVGIVRTRIFFN